MFRFGESPHCQVFGWYYWWWGGADSIRLEHSSINLINKLTHVSSLVLFALVGGMSCVSSISTMRTSPDWISAEPSHDIIIGKQSLSDEQSSGVCKMRRKKEKIKQEHDTIKLLNI